METNWPQGVQGGAAQPVFVVGGDSNPANAGVPTSETWRVSLQSSVVVDQNSKTFPVPAGQEWQVLSAHVAYVSQGTAGDRQLVMEGLDALGNVIYEARAGAVQAATLTRYYEFAPGLEPMVAFLDTDFISVPIAPFFLSALWQVRFRDNNNVAVTDDILVQMVIASRQV